VAHNVQSKSDGDLMSKPVLILFGTQSGNSEDLASQLAKSATSHNLTPTVLDMDAASVEMMASSERILIICSTWGEGEMPDSAEALWDSINAEGVPKMENTYFSVCSLGDTSYEFFCQSGKDWDLKLEELGAKRVFPRQDCDVDFDDTYAAWAAGALPAISSVGSSVAEVVAEVVEESKAEESSTDDANLTAETIQLAFKIFRYNPLLIEKGWDTYECKMPGHFSVLDALNSIKSTFDPTLSFRGCGPLSGIIVNGAVVRADRTRLLDIVELCGHELKIEPLTGYEIVKDLVISTKNYDGHRRKSTPWMMPATRSGVNTVSGTTIGTMDASKATELHELGDIDSPQLLHSFSDTLPYDSEYIGPALVMHAWKRVNDERYSEKARQLSINLLQNDGGAWNESDCSSFGRQGDFGKKISNSFNECRAELIRKKGFSGKHGRLVKWYGLSVKWSGKVNETTLYRQVLGPLGLVSNLFSGVSMRMMLGFTRTGAKPFRSIFPLLAPPAGIGKIPPMINSKVDSHHEVANLFNKLDKRF